MLLQVTEAITLAESISRLAPITLIAFGGTGGWYLAYKFQKEKNEAQIAMIEKAEIVTEKIVKVTIEAKDSFDRVAELHREILVELRQLNRDKR
jgi:hypothetical protein